MNRDNWLIAEYDQIRQEITARVQFLHKTISLGVVFLVLLVVVYFWLINQGVEKGIIERFLLLWPVFFALLTFNYQANQMTLEAGARYLNSWLKGEAEKVSNGKVLEWDVFFGEHKRGQRMASFLKVMPLLLPLIMPFILLISSKGLPSGVGNQVLFFFDLVLFLVVIANFKYKL